MRQIKLVFGVGLLLAAVGCDADGDVGRDAAGERHALGKADATGSCLSSAGQELCGGKSEGNCWCDDQCSQFGDCCSDLADVCDGGGDDGADDGGDDGADDGGPAGDSCVGSCGSQAPGGCWCDGSCAQFGDCCGDHAAACGGEPPPPPPPPPPATCEGSCGGKSPGGCWCDDQCSQFGDCCADIATACEAPPQTCAEIVPAFLAETAEIRSCQTAADCGQVLAGTSCGCTRNWVARLDANLSEWSALRTLANENECSIPGSISTCDCPVADGFRCNAGTCGWNYL